MIAKLLRALRFKRDLDRSLKARKIVRQARAEAARKGIHTEINRCATMARTMFGEG